MGSRLPAYCTSLGRALLAHLTTDELGAHLDRIEPKRQTENTITAKRVLKKAILAAREHGSALVDRELEIGLRSNALAIFGRQKAVVAAMNVGVQATRVSEEEMRTRILPVLRHAGEELGSRLAH